MPNVKTWGPQLSLLCVGTVVRIMPSAWRPVARTGQEARFHPQTTAPAYRLSSTLSPTADALMSDSEQLTVIQYSIETLQLPGVVLIHICSR